MTGSRPSPHPRILAIDGPSGTGKSSVARDVARRLGAGYLDTGAMYRALTLTVLAEGLDPADADAVSRRAETVRIEVATDPEIDHVGTDGQDVTELIRSLEVTAAVSAVSAIPAVRRRLVEIQRDLAQGTTMVVEGRDIGTVVFPDAALKIFLTADPAARAARRSGQLGLVDPAEIAALTESLRARDEFDSSRAQSPLRPAADAIVIDSTELSRAQVVEAILRAVTARSRSE